MTAPEHLSTLGLALIGYVPQIALLLILVGTFPDERTTDQRVR